MKTTANFIIYAMTLLALCICSFVIVDHGNLKSDLEDIASEVNTLHEVSNEILLYKEIEDIWFEKGGDYMTNQMLRELAYVTYRYHEKYGTHGQIPIGLDYWRIFAWIDVESKFNPEAESYAGAIGLTQHMYITAVDGLDRYFELQGLSRKQVLDYLYNPVWNLRLGLERLIDYQTDFIASGMASDSDWKLTFSLYNWSTKAVSNLMSAVESGTPKASLKYALDIEQLLQEYNRGI